MHLNLSTNRRPSMDSYERDLLSGGVTPAAGIDEAGRGPLAGPVVAAAVIFDFPPPVDSGIRDSKTLTARRREALLLQIYETARSVGVGVVWHDEIDRINIHQATLKAMEMAVTDLTVRPAHLLIDGPHRIGSPLPQTPVVKGDSLCLSIAAASIVAKVVRDGIMAVYDDLFPGYDFSRHKGYGTKKHLEALKRLGPCPVHRMTFRGVCARDDG